MGLETNSIVTNMLAMNSSRQMNIVTDRKAKSTEKLSSGYRINRAADDAAGLAISEKMRRQIRGLNQSAENIQDGVSFCQVADGYLNEVQDMLHRMSELAVKSANGTNSDQDREYMDKEVQQLKSETERIFKDASFNEIKIWEVPYMPSVSMIASASGMVPDMISDQLPPGVSFDTPSAQSGHMKNTFTDSNGKQYRAATYVDFSGADMSDLSSFNNCGFYCTCCTCERRYSISFDSTTTETKVEGQEHLICTIGIEGLDRVEDLLEKIVEATGGNPNHHFTNLAINPDNSKQLVIYDNRPDMTANGDYGLVGAGVCGEKMADMYDSGAIVFNSGIDTNGDPVYGGIEVNQVRHTWSELGISVSDDGKSFIQDQEIEFNDYTGERVCIKVKKDDPLPVVARNFNWTADENGIYVNNIFATDWASIGVKATDNEGSFSFQFKNMVISFSVNDGDNLEEVIKGVNGGEDLSGYYTWDLVVGSAAEYQALNINSGSVVNVSNANKELIDRSFTVKADENGVWLEDDKDDSYTKMSWSSFIGNSSSISDWGLSDIDGQGKNSNTITFSEDDQYTYVNTVGDMNISFGFKIQDPSSQSAAIAALNGIVMSGTVTARGDIQTDNINVKAINNYMDFQMQRAQGRDFDDANAKLEGEINKTLVKESDTAGHFEYSGSFAGKEMEKVIGQSFDLNRAAAFTDIVDVVNDDGRTMTLRFSNNSASQDDETTKVTFQAQGFAYRGFNPNEKSSGNLEGEAIFSDFVMNNAYRILDIQSGTESDQIIRLKWEPLNNSIIGIGTANVLTQRNAMVCMDQTKVALERVSRQRSQFGAYQNRLEHAYNINRNVSENTQAAESLIRDTDMAKEMVAYSKENILQQAGQTMLAQANQNRQGILQLLQ